MSKKMVYLDTNTFYEFLATYGFPFSSVNVGDNTTIDYARLKTEFDNLIKKKQIALTSTLLFEVIAHHRNNLAELRKIFLFLQFLSKEKPFPLIINHNGPCFAHLVHSM